MIRLRSEQLNKQLKKTLYPCYLLLGNDLFMIQETRDLIHNKAKEQQFDHYFHIVIDSNTNWDVIFNLCRNQYLFSNHQIISLVLPDMDNQLFIENNLLKLSSFLYKNIIIIIHSKKFTQTIKNSDWFKSLCDKKLIIINCSAPNKHQMPFWVINRAKNMQLTLDNTSCQLLCYFYENNLLALSQALKRISLIYPDKEEVLTLSKIKIAINDSSLFISFEWINAILEGKSKRAIHILRQIQLKNEEPAILLRLIQKKVLLLLNFKQEIIRTSINVLFDTYKVWRDHRSLLIKVLDRLTILQLEKAITLIIKIELSLKKNDNYFIWFYLNILTLLLCGKNITFNNYL